MILNTKIRYAIIAVIDIAVNYNNQPIKLSEIALRQDISLNYLEQIFMKLKSAKIVKSVKGPGGGYTLVSTNFEVAKVVKAMADDFELAKCKIYKGIDCNKQTIKCKTHQLWAGLQNQIELFFQSITLNDVIEDRIAQVLDKINIPINFDSHNDYA